MNTKMENIQHKKDGILNNTTKPGTPRTTSTSKTKSAKRVLSPLTSSGPQGKETQLDLWKTGRRIRNSMAGITAQSEKETCPGLKVLAPPFDDGEAPAPENSTKAPNGGRHVLFVDDDVELVNVGGSLLEELGYQVTGSTGSLEALEYFRKHHDSVDLVISDLNMPNMTGPELATEIHRTDPEMPFILITGFNETLKPEKLKQCGILKSLNKPIIMTELALAVQEAFATNH